MIKNNPQVGETNRIGRNVSFALFTIEVQVFQLLQNSDFFLKLRGASQRSKIFYRWLPCSFIGPERKQTSVLFSKQELSDSRLVLVCDSFSLQ